MSWAYPGLMQAVGASNKVFEFIDRKPEIQYEKGVQAPPSLQGSIQFEDVTFLYPSRPDTPVLKVSQTHQLAIPFAASWRPVSLPTTTMLPRCKMLMGKIDDIELPFT